MALLFFSIPVTNWIASSLTATAIFGHFLSVRSIALKEPDDELFSSVTPASAFNVIYFLFVSPLWGIDYWSTKENRKRQRKGIFRSGDKSG
ncbi:hypothetical protein ACT3SZ_03715 [Corynebacterium sp. AOP40-9SA-29]